MCVVQAPRTWAGKVVMLAHGWFFLIIIASYTANLASVLTTASLAPSITSWNDITAQVLRPDKSLCGYTGMQTLMKLV